MSEIGSHPFSSLFGGLAIISGIAGSFLSANSVQSYLGWTGFWILVTIGTVARMAESDLPVNSATLIGISAFAGGYCFSRFLKFLPKETKP